MKLSYTSNKLVKVSDISIPKKFFTRMKTEVTELDNLFGDGILPGLTFTVTAAPGTGKTTLLLQLLDNLSKKGYSTGYFTGEEDIRQIAFTCKRLGVTEVSICNETDIDKICAMTKDLDIIVIDSFPCITLSGTHNKSTREKAIVEKLIKAAEDNECAIGAILHITKGGTYKGGTLIPHAVGANFMLETDPDDDSVRIISSSKNRYGSTANIAVAFGCNGFNFEQCRTVNKAEKAPSKADAMKAQLDKIMKMDPPNITMQHIMKDLDCNRTRAYILLKELTDAGKLTKYGRGDAAVWKCTDVKV
jgi:predicted ATP-dependent serine protease